MQQARSIYEEPRALVAAPHTPILGTALAVSGSRNTRKEVRAMLWETTAQHWKPLLGTSLLGGVGSMLLYNAVVFTETPSLAEQALAMTLASSCLFFSLLTVHFILNNLWKVRSNNTALTHEASNGNIAALQHLDWRAQHGDQAASVLLKTLPVEVWQNSAYGTMTQAQVACRQLFRLVTAYHSHHALLALWTLNMHGALPLGYSLTTIPQLNKRISRALREPQLSAEERVKLIKMRGFYAEKRTVSNEAAPRELAPAATSGQTVEPQLHAIPETQTQP